MLEHFAAGDSLAATPAIDNAAFLADQRLKPALLHSLSNINIHAYKVAKQIGESLESMRAEVLANPPCAVVEAIDATQAGAMAFYRTPSFDEDFKLRMTSWALCASMLRACRPFMRSHEEIAGDHVRVHNIIIVCDGVDKGVLLSVPPRSYLIPMS